MELSSLTHKKAQIWGIDLFAASLIFSVSMAFFYFYLLNDRESPKENIELLQYRGKVITDSLLSEGSPDNWVIGNVFEIGLLSNGKINETKLEQFYNLSQNNYQLTKSLFNSEYDYYFFLERNMTIGALEIEGIGKPGITKNNIIAKNLIKVSRVSVYKNRPIGATLYIWKE